MSWFRDSVWTEYPAGHVDGPQGSATSKDAAFNSVNRDVHWMSLSGAGNYGVVALANGRPLHLHGRIENNNFTLFLSSAAASNGDTPGDDIRLTQSTPLAGVSASVWQQTQNRGKLRTIIAGWMVDFFPGFALASDQRIEFRLSRRRFPTKDEICGRAAIFVSDCFVF